MTVFTDGLRNPGDLSIDELQSGLGSYLGATAAEAWAESPLNLMTGMKELSEAQSGREDLGSQIERLQRGEDLADVVSKPRPVPDVPMADAKARVKDAGLEQHLDLGNGESIKQPALDIMIDRARTRRERETTIARGPSGFVPGALSVGTSLFVGALDPLNVALSVFPILGEARYAKLLADAGESLVRRAAVRTGVGVAGGLAFTAGMQPLTAAAHFQEGRDFTLAEALTNTVMGGALFGVLHTGGGFAADVARAIRGRRLYPFGEGEPYAIKPQATAVETMPSPLGGEGSTELPRVGPGEGAPPHPSELAEPPGQPSPPRGEGAITPAGDRAAPIGDVYADVRAQLAGAGMSDEAADANAAVVAARYAARAERLGDGTSAWDLYQGEGLSIRRGDAGAIVGRSFDQRRNAGAPDLFAQREADGQMNLPGTERIGQGELAQRRADQPLRPGKEQKPMDIGLFSDDAKQKSFFQSAQVPPFYSAVARAIDAARQEKAPAAQWLGTLRNTAGVKPEELEWLGLEAWLKAQNGPVSKQAIADYVRANAIEVKEVTKGSPDAMRESFAAWRAENPGVDAAVWREQNAALIAEAQDLGQAKYAQWQLPGGENYRELLLTLPPVRTEPFGVRFDESKGGYVGIDDVGRDLTPGAFDSPAAAMDAANSEFAAAWQGTIYRSSHFDEPNILAHVRFNDRTIDGKRTLFVEEIQSDWHQAGKRRGYRTGSKPTRTVAEIDRDMDANLAELSRRSPDEPPETIWQRHPDLAARHDELMRERNAAAGIDTGVPDAPFKTTWPELALKRMIRYAAERGYDQIAWTSGKTQAERYDLSKQITRLYFQRNADGTFDLNADTTGGDAAHIGNAIPEAKLPDYIGKEAADRILDKLKRKPEAEPIGSLEGLDLRVGGEGMAGFYDKMLPAAANKLAKKFGGKVERSEIEVVDTADIDVPFVVRDAEGRIVERDLHWETYAEQRAQEIGGSYEFDPDVTAPKAEPVHVLPITDKLRDAAVGEGFPLFQRDAQGGPRGRITFAENKAIVDLYARADRSTFMHEMGHLWLEELVRDAAHAKAPKALKDDLDTVLKWLGVDKAADIATAHHEQWARGFERYLAEGKAPSSRLAAAFDKFREWLTAIYRSLAELGAPLSDDVRGVMDRMLATDAEIMARLADLPPRAKEDAMRAGVAALVSGEPVKVGELLDAAAQSDPRIAESWAPQFAAIAELKQQRGEAFARAMAARQAQDFAALNEATAQVQRLDAEIAAAERALPPGMSAEQAWRELSRSERPEDAAAAVEASKAADALPEPESAKPAIAETRPLPDLQPAAAAAAAEPDDVVTKHVSLKPRGPRARDPQTWSLLEFLASRGGIDPEDPLIGDVRGSIGRSNKFIPGFGHLIRKGGMRLDRAREAAVEAGYIADAGARAGGQAESTVSTLLEAMDGELRGRRVYREGVTPEMSKAELAHAREQELAVIERKLDGALADSGIDPASVTGAQRARVLEIMQREGETDPFAALEREALEFVEHGKETGQQERIAEPIPGWDDVPDDFGSTPPAGSAAPQVGGSGSAPPRGGIRGARPGGGEAAADGAGRSGPDFGIKFSRLTKAALEAEDEARALSRFADETGGFSDAERAALDDTIRLLDTDATSRIDLIRQSAACLAQAGLG